MSFKIGDKVKRKIGSQVEGTIIGIYEESQYLILENGERSELMASAGDYKVRFGDNVTPDAMKEADLKLVNT
jgi:membrane protease subunit (stomatin/prohibitin family)